MCSCVKKPYAVLKFWPTRYTDTTCSRNDDSVGKFYSSHNMLDFISNTLPSLLLVLPGTGEAEMCMDIGGVP